ncbi:MAG: hypothetical protein K9N46_05870 [Candidatus Marinimicrobia bacterium]|nr:hypothetical protein [Candidatus Neomarinimicrobiota bacterium]MCF7880248.1 hypothetical protein [Candidatus Neomarinimicrobiota bacterium]
MQPSLRDYPVEIPMGFRPGRDGMLSAPGFIPGIELMKNRKVPPGTTEIRLVYSTVKS